MPKLNRVVITAGIVCLCAAGAHAQENPVLDMVAQMVIMKFQNSSCQEIAQERSQGQSGPQAAMMQRFVSMMHENPQIREDFLNRVAGPIANKLFECNMIP